MKFFFKVNLSDPPGATGKIIDITDNYDCVVEYYDPTTRKNGIKTVTRQMIEKDNKLKMHVLVLLYKLNVRPNRENT